MIAMQYQHNEILHPAHSFGTKQDKKEDEKTNTFSEIAFRGRECRYGNGILKECVLTYEGDSNIYPIIHYDTKSTYCQAFS